MVSPRRSAPRWRPRRPRCTASVPEDVKVTSSGRSPERLGRRGPGVVEDQPRGPPGVVEPPRVGVRRVEGGHEGLAGGRVQGLPGRGVEVDPAAVLRGALCGWHGANLTARRAG